MMKKSESKFENAKKYRDELWRMLDLFMLEK